MTVVRADPAEQVLAPGTGRLVLDISRSALSPHLRDRRVAVTVDGYPLRFAWGQTAIVLPAGRHHVEIEVEDAHGWGRVVDAVPVAAGHTVDAYYRAPAMPGMAGALGPSAQRTRGASLCATLAAAAVAMLGGLVAVVIVLGLQVAGLLG